MEREKEKMEGQKGKGEGREGKGGEGVEEGKGFGLRLRCAKKEN